MPKKKPDLEMLMWFIEGKANDVAAHIESRLAAGLQDELRIYMAVFHELRKLHDQEAEG